MGTSPYQALPWGLESYGKKKMLLIAEKDKDLYFIDNIENSGYYKQDILCFFCENGIDPKLLGGGYVENCLARKEWIGVKFCRDFVPGPAFGQNREKDLTNIEVAAKLLPKIMCRDSLNCKFWNINNITDYTEGSMYIDTFCGILGKKPETSYCRTCKSFEISLEMKVKYEQDSRRMLNYINDLKSMEKTKCEEHVEKMIKICLWRTLAHSIPEFI
jgi:DNA-directed RNA polymerase subunit F